MDVPEPLAKALAALARVSRPLLVGGCVRDWLRGEAPKDFDVEVFGIDWDELVAALSPLGPVNLVGRSFGVVKARIAGVEYDFSLPRRESKTGAGHRGFAVEPDPTIDERAAAARRDFTINAIYYDPATRTVIDHHGGRADLEAGVLRHTSAAFADDPLRVLRAFQFAARFDYCVALETLALCRTMRPSYGELPRERVWQEWQKWAQESRRPSRGLAVLKETGWLECFPEIAALDGLEQEPAWHPEGDVLNHTGHCLDALVGFDAWRETAPEERAILSFAVLAHDFGKATTTDRGLRGGIERWISPGHDQASGPLCETFLEDLHSPVDMRAPVRRLVENHHVHQSWPVEGPSAAAVRRLARKLDPATIEQLILVMKADHRGRPPLLPEETTIRIEKLRETATELALETKPPAPLILGRDLIALGMRPSPAFGSILQAAYEAQLDGTFTDHGKGMQWLRKYLDLAVSPEADPPEEKE